MFQTRAPEKAEEHVPSQTPLRSVYEEEEEEDENNEWLFHLMCGVTVGMLFVVGVTAVLLWVRLQARPPLHKTVLCNDVLLTYCNDVYFGARNDSVSYKDHLM